MLNRCEFIGRLGKSPEIRSTQNGDKVVSLSLGVTEKWKDRATGEQREKTEWIKATCFDERLCNTLEQHGFKGQLLRIVGQMQTRKYTDQQGVEKYSTEIAMQKYKSELTILQWREKGQQPQQQSQYQPGSQELDSDIPF